MADNTAGALKVLIEAANLAQGITVTQDDAPEGKAYPYIVIGGPLTVIPDKLEDGGIATIREPMTVDLWQRWKNADNSLAEIPNLGDLLIKLLGDARLPAHPKIVYSCNVTGAARLFERDANFVHHALTVEVRRQL